MPTAPLHEVWRRPKADRYAAWEKVPGLEPAPASQLLGAVQAQLWLATEVEYEFAILPVGVRPSQHGSGGGQRQPMTPRYRTKVMRPE